MALVVPQPAYVGPSKVHLLSITEFWKKIFAYKLNEEREPAYLVEVKRKMMTTSMNLHITTLLIDVCNMVSSL
jgi:hypothetical protein